MTIGSIFITFGHVLAGSVPDPGESGDSRTDSIMAEQGPIQD